MRCRSKLWRKRRLRELPPDDGLVPATLDGRQVFVDPEVLKPAFEAKMAMHDDAHPAERWGHNQWGAGWLQSPGVVRAQFEWKAPRVSTDLGMYEYLQRIAEYESEGKMAKLTEKARNKMPAKDFALPGKGKGPSGKGAGSYPIEDKSHARNALARVSQHGTPAEKATVRAKVKAKFPGIGGGKKPERGGERGARR